VKRYTVTKSIEASIEKPITVRMVRDIYIRIFFIPLLGILIPFLSGIITYNKYSLSELIGIHVYFIFTSFCIWAGCNKAHRWLRKKFKPNSNIFINIITVSFVSTLYSAIIGGLLTIIWFSLAREVFAVTKLVQFILYTAFAVSLFTLLYEVLFLHNEKEEHIKMAGALDKELLQAETSILRNELDPHFLFNSLTTLKYLINNNPEQAAIYNENLAQVYKYILRSKNRETVSLAEEMEFMQEYFSLLQIRYANKLILEINTKEKDTKKTMIVPCALQILIENAIKHNELSQDAPLQITISLNGDYLKVSNNIMPKPYLLNSTETGLKNLSSRYKLITSRDISIHKTDHHFTVNIPLITTIKPYTHA
jgi:two-component system, LytTR family, sensor kinase